MITTPLSSNTQQSSAYEWYLEGLGGSQGETWQVCLNRFPFTVGRDVNSDLCLSAPEISRQHAQFHLHNDELILQEFGSKNGTFVNNERIHGSRHLQNGDLLKFVFLEFRLNCYQTPTNHCQPLVLERPQVTVLSNHNQIEELIQTRSVSPYFQPLVYSQNCRQLLGYELLGRGSFQGLPESPVVLFQLARMINKEIQLSELFREMGAEYAKQLRPDLDLFFNTVPQETTLEILKHNLPKLRQIAPELRMTMEVHEGAVTDIKTMRNVRALLSDLDMRLAYDDFGAGQARLLELIEVPPDVLKFDLGLIRNIHQRSEKSLQMIKSLVSMTKELGIATLAEGTELREEVDVCVAIGFDYLQGFYFGKPLPYFKNTIRTEHES
jgi:EAL domain-containing protein (putative c-di-GMP-specific phosphodiesterase class I)